MAPSPPEGSILHIGPMLSTESGPLSTWRPGNRSPEAARASTAGANEACARLVLNKQPSRRGEGEAAFEERSECAPMRVSEHRRRQRSMRPPEWLL